MQARLDIPNRQQDHIRNVREPKKPKKAQGDAVNALGASTPSALTPRSKCGGTGHTAAYCMNVITIAEKRYDSIKAAQEAGGYACKTCNGIGHNARDHIKMMKQYSSSPPATRSDPGQGKPDDQSRQRTDKGDGKGNKKRDPKGNAKPKGEGKGKSQPSGSQTREPCPHGPKCKTLKTSLRARSKGDYSAPRCTYHHSPQETQKVKENLQLISPDPKAKAKANAKAKAQAEPPAGGGKGGKKGDGKNKKKNGTNPAQQGTAYAQGTGVPAGTFNCLNEGQESLCSMIGLATAQQLMPPADASKKYTAKLEETAQRLLKRKAYDRLHDKFEKGDSHAPGEAIRLLCSKTSKMRYKSMSEIPPERIFQKARSAPVGYAAMTSVTIAGVTIPALLDSGASTSAIPEEVFLMLLEAADNSGIEIGSKRHPVAQIDIYVEGQALMGIDCTATAMLSQYAVVLLVEFVPASGSLGEGCNPVKPLYFKVLPKGNSDFEGVYLGYPVLDNKETSLNWKVGDTTHYFANIDCALPRLELPRRAHRALEYEEWCKHGTYKDRGSGKEKGLRLVERVARICMDAEDIVLAPGEKAVIPALWDRSMQSQLALVAQPEHANFYVEPGVVDMKDSQLMVIAGNPTSDSITLSRGQELAQAYQPPEDLPTELIRRDFQPGSGAMPEVLRFRDRGNQRGVL